MYVYEYVYVIWICLCDYIIYIYILRMSHFCCFCWASSSGFARAVAFPRRLQVLSCSTWLILRCCINSFSCVLASLARIVYSNSMHSIRRAASSGRWGVAYAAETVPPRSWYLVIVIFIYIFHTRHCSTHDLHKPYLWVFFWLYPSVALARNSNKI